MKRPRFVGLLAAITLTSALLACGSEAQGPSGIRKVVSTTSFGMCVGYCSTRLEISEGQVVLLRTARGGRGGQDQPDQKFTATLTTAEWREIAQLARNTQLDGLPGVIGCPDCADGGAESLTIIGAGGEKTISFDHGANIEQAKPLLDRVRALRATLMPKP